MKSDETEWNWVKSNSLLNVSTKTDKFYFKNWMKLDEMGCNRVKSVEIGWNRKNRQNRQKTILDKTEWKNIDFVDKIDDIDGYYEILQTAVYKSLVDETKF